jgi:hypothetical protein
METFADDSEIRKKYIDKTYGQNIQFVYIRDAYSSCCAQNVYVYLSMLPRPLCYFGVLCLILKEINMKFELKQHRHKFGSSTRELCVPSTES